MESLFIDEKEVHRHSSDKTPYNINYVVFGSGKHYLDVVKSDAIKQKEALLKEKEACFSGLRNINPKDENRNKIMYFCRFNHRKGHVLKKKEIKRWVILCQRHKLLPEINREFFRTGEVCFDMVSNSKPLLFLYLCCVRHIQENPWYIRSALYFHDQLHMGFFSSIYLASGFGIANQNHHFIPEDKYSLRNVGYEIKNNNFNVRYMIALHKFVNTNKNDGKIFSYHFGLHDALASIASTATNTTVVGAKIASPETEQRITSFKD